MNDNPNDLTFELSLLPPSAWAQEKLEVLLIKSGRNDWVEIIDEANLGQVEPYRDDGERSFSQFENKSYLNLKLYFLSEDTQNEIISKINATFCASLPYETSAFLSSDWKYGWQKQLPEIITQDFFVHAPWIKPSSTEKRHTIEIDPGMAFGTGHHATTFLCLEALSWLKNQISQLESAELWDVGTGTGILAIAAKKLGISKIFAWDIDADACRIAKENAVINKVEMTICTIPENTEAPWFKPQKSTQIVVANIISSVLIRIMPGLVTMFSKTASSRILVLSGLLDSQETEVSACLLELQSSAKLLKSLSKDGWVCLIFQLEESH